MKSVAEKFSGGASELVFWSFRYFLGRHTIHTWVFARELSAAWPELHEKDRAMIKKELEEAFTRDNKMRSDSECSPIYYPLGPDNFRAAWLMVLEASRT